MKMTAGPQGAIATREMRSIESADSAPPPPTPSLVAPPGDSCPSCSSPMAAGQHYCLECGERRGESRLTSLEQAAAQPQAVAAAPLGNAAATTAMRGRSPGLALIATIALLLLAMGVGVLIGNDSGSTSSGVAQQPIIIGGAAPTAATAAAVDAKVAASKDAKTAEVEASSDQSGTNADAVAKKNGVKLAPKDAQLGDKCDKGAVGCDDGEFTGDFFGN